MTPSMYLPKDYDLFVGLDVDKNSFSFTVKDHHAMSRSKKIPSEPEQLHNYMKNHFAGKKILYAYEAGGTGFHLHDYLVAKDEDCLVVSPLSIPKAPNQKVKNNRLDSLRIVDELRAGKLTSIRVPQGQYRELRHLINLRENYVYNRKAAKQRIKALLLYVHLDHVLKDVEQNWSNHYIQILKKLSCSQAERQRLDMLLIDLEYARKQTLLVLRQLQQLVKNSADIQENMKYLESLPGIGLITAVTILGRIGDPKYLKNVRELAAFLGLVPREKSTGDNINQGSITHLGDHHLRALLIEGSWAAIRKDQELNQFYHRIKNRHHPKIGPKKAIVAVARKLTQRIYCVLKEQRFYRVH
jgi:transposase